MAELEEEEEEEEEEADCSRDLTTKKKEAHKYHNSVMPCSWQIREDGHAPLFVVHALLWVVYAPVIGVRIFRWAESCVAVRPQTP